MSKARWTDKEQDLLKTAFTKLNMKSIEGKINWLRCYVKRSADSILTKAKKEGLIDSKISLTKIRKPGLARVKKTTKKNVTP